MLTQCTESSSADPKHELVIATFTFYIFIICYCHFNNCFHFHNVELVGMETSDLVSSCRLNCNVGDWIVLVCSTLLES